MIVTKRECMASLIHDTSPTLRHSLQQSHNKGLYYGFRDAILSRIEILPYFLIKIFQVGQLKILQQPKNVCRP